MSFTVRIEDFDLSMLNKMKEEARLLFKSCCLLSQNVSPSMWTLCNAVPYHVEVTFNEYNLGLRCNTMEGREQKQQQIEKYAHNTTFHCRWPLIFRHEYIELIYLRENGYDTVNYRKRKNQYVPLPLDASNCCSKCGLKYRNGSSCFICDSVFMKIVHTMIFT